MVGDAGRLVAGVVAVVWRGDRRWVYIDAGVFTGFNGFAPLRTVLTTA